MTNEIQQINEQNQIIGLQKRQFDALAAGGFLPKGCSKDEGFARIVAGAQMGMKPLQALNGIAMINGHPTLHSDSIPCVVMASGLVEGMHYKFEGDGDTLACTFYVKRRDVAEYQEWTYSMDDAKKAGLLNSPTWKAHTKKMLFNRARSWCLRNTFPDVLGNLYTKDEVENADFSEVPPKHEETPEDYDALPLDKPVGAENAQTPTMEENATVVQESEVVDETN